MDDSAGRVLDYLKKNHLEKDTIVIYSSDRGFYNGEHGWYDKRWMYEDPPEPPIDDPSTARPCREAIVR